MIKFRNAKISDIDNVLKLHFRYQVDSIKSQDKVDGFVTTSFTKDQMVKLIEKENGLFIAVDEDEIIAYVMAASWQFWSIWPIFAYMINDLSNHEYLGNTLSINNSYQYGPICIDKKYRGQGVLENIFEYSRVEMHKKYPVLVTFINKINPRSINAHTKKLNLEILCEFEFNENQYYALVYDASRKVTRE